MQSATKTEPLIQKLDIRGPAAYVARQSGAAWGETGGGWGDVGRRDVHDENGWNAEARSDQPTPYPIRPPRQLRYWIQSFALSVKIVAPSKTVC